MPGVGAAGLKVATGAPAAHTSAGSSSFPTFLLIALIAAAAVAVGVLATAVKRRLDDGAEYPVDT